MVKIKKNLMYCYLLVILLVKCIDCSVLIRIFCYKNYINNFDQVDENV